ncbi:MAG: YbbR-like domain-containing protein [Candidatus Aminicenantes bacterium]
MIKFIRNLFLKNWGLKLFSLILALILWINLIPEEKIFSEKTLTVPLELYNIPSDMELMEKPPSTVDIRIRAPQRIISQFNAANVHAVLNLEKASVGQTEYPLNKNMISIPQGAEVKDIYPSLVKLRLEQTKEIMMEVKPTLIGELPEGIKLSRIEVIPPEVPIKGPESKIESSSKVRTSPIDISSLTQSAEMEADLILPDPNLKLVSTQTKVKVRIVVQRQNNILP